MKSFAFVLAMSMAVNVAFVVALRRDVRAIVTTPATGLAGVSHPTNDGATTAAAPGTPTDGNRWSELNPGDARTLVVRLREAGFPEAMVRAAVREEIAEKYRQRRRTLLGDKVAPYWQPTFDIPDRTKLTDLRLTGLAEAQEVRDVLGLDALWGDDDISRARSEKSIGNFPPEKWAGIVRVLDESFMRKMRAYPTDRPFARQDAAVISAIDAEQDAALAKLLTPEELEAYNLRNSSTAYRLRYLLTDSGFAATEDEYRRLYRVYDAAWHQQEPTVLSDERESARQQETDARLREQAKLVLGAERYAEFELATSNETSGVARLVAKLDLPPAAARDVVRVQQDVQARIKAMRETTALTSDDRAAQLAALAAETQRRLTATLGARGYEAYREGPGQWVTHIGEADAPGH